MLFAEYLANEKMPEGYKFSGPITKKSLKSNLTRLAQDKPEQYPDIVQNLKKVGDMFATYEGVSVGLDDITPDYKVRDAVVREARKKMSTAKNKSDLIKVLLKAQKTGLDKVMQRDNALRRQVESGSRGKPGQLLKTIFSPMVVKGKSDIPQLYLIDRSYSEGLTPGQFWLTAGESRRELATTQLATAIPGDSSKQLTATLNNVMVTTTDCGTTNGLEYSTDDHQIKDRYEAKTNKLLTDSLIRQYKKAGKKTIIVRSPMTCKEHPGVCQMCYGKNIEGQLPTMGTNVGLRAAQMLSEPLTQMVLSAKHGGMMAKGEEAKLRGTMGFRQLVDIPKVFKDEAVLSYEDGKVNKVEKSPQGGHSVFINSKKYYVDPKREVLVKPGQSVAKGSQISDGIPNPRHVVELRGLGPGRKYMADTIYDIYNDSGVDIDKRHVELLVKQDLNQVKMLKNDPKGNFVRGEIVPYNQARNMVKAEKVGKPVNYDLIGNTLASDHLHYTSGSPITKEMVNKLKMLGVKKVEVAGVDTPFEPIMRPMEQVPLMSQDWVSRLAHRRIKDTLLEGAAQGWSSPTHGTSPYPALIYGGSTFSEKEENRY